MGNDKPVLGPSMLRFLVLFVLLLLAFAVVQPVVWKAIWDQDPAQSSDLANLTEISIAVQAVGLALFGLAAFELIQERLKRQTDALFGAKQQEVDVLIAREVKRQTDELTKRLIQFRLRVAFHSWFLYERVWDQANYQADFYEVSPEGMPFGSDQQVFKELVDYTIVDIEEAMALVQALPDDDESKADQLLKCQNNLAYHLATRRRPGDGALALRLIGEMKVPAEDLDYVETKAWVHLRFAPTSAESKVAGLEMYEMIRADTTQPAVWRLSIQRKYEKVFAAEIRAATPNTVQPDATVRPTESGESTAQASVSP